MTRYALVMARAETVEQYLPANYRVLHSVKMPDDIIVPDQTVIAGEDNAGWTLDDYVIPRLASGLYFAEEIDLSHPIMKEVPDNV